MRFKDALDAGYALLVEVLQSAHPLLVAIEEADRIVSSDKPNDDASVPIDNHSSLTALRSVLAGVEKKGLLVG